MMNHTPGPWTLYRGEDGPISVVTWSEQPKDRRTVARISEPFVKFPADQIEANAHIIAAAPEMFAALAFMNEISQQTLEDPDGNISIDGSIHDRELLRRAIDLVRTAIKKARA